MPCSISFYIPVYCIVFLSTVVCFCECVGLLLFVWKIDFVTLTYSVDVYCAVFYWIGSNSIGLVV